MMKYRSSAACWYKTKHLAYLEDREFKEEKPHKSLTELFNRKTDAIKKTAQDAFITQAVTNDVGVIKSQQSLITEANRVADSAKISVSSLWGKLTGPKKEEEP